MDLIQLLITVAAVLGMIVVGLLAVIPTALEVRDTSDRRGGTTPLVTAVAAAALGQAPAGDPPATRELADQLPQPSEQPLHVVTRVVDGQAGSDRAAAA